jgi:periplasmic divalent cation tolerance protein
MKKASSFYLVLVTAPNRKVARQLAAAALKSHLVACANLLPGIESHYWWNGKMESAAEVLILFKTIRAHLSKLEKLVLKNHPYDTPEFVAVPLSGGNHHYLEWLRQSVRPTIIPRAAG